MRVKFQVRDDIKIIHDGITYNKQDLARAVSFWSHQINQISDCDKILGVCYGSLSFSNLAFKLALIASGKSYEKINDLENLIVNYVNYSAVFITGDTQNYKDFNNNLPSTQNKIIYTDRYSFAHKIQAWNKFHNLKISFQEQQEIIEYTSGTTGVPKKTSVNAYIQGCAVRCAINTYFDPNDRCVFLHSMHHTGVHTTAILPAVFCTSFLCLSNPVTWGADIEQATHIQFFTPMRDFFPLPKKLRTLVFGGDMLKPLLTNYIFDHCQVENFIDIYGLTECYPPLAVRRIKSIKDLNNPFDWVNKHHRPRIVDNILVIERSDGQLVNTGDEASINAQGQLIMLGRKTNTVRINGVLHSALEFKYHFEKNTGITDHVLFFENNSAILLTHTHHQIQVEQYAKEHGLEAELRFEMTLNTSGGIKHIK